MKSFVTVTSIDCSAAALPIVSLRIFIDIERRTSSSNGLKTTISSIRLSNSGFIFFSSSLLTAPSMVIPSVDPFLAVGFSPREIWMISWLPILDVMIKMEFLKDTTTEWGLRRIASVS
eukprot:CCRYP_018427-RA/>CCRYP_018427-RA protein AED:0.26 eAED:0.53 QI:0/0/0.5/1/0/0/2/214/117